MTVQALKQGNKIMNDIEHTIDMIESLENPNNYSWEFRFQSPDVVVNGLAGGYAHITLDDDTKNDILIALRKRRENLEAALGRL